MAISPDQSTLVSVGAEGSILMWQIPQAVAEAKQESDMPTLKDDKK
jgi:hypothetical protein